MRHELGWLLALAHCLLPLHFWSDSVSLICLFVSDRPLSQVKVTLRLTVSVSQSVLVSSPHLGPLSVKVKVKVTLRLTVSQPVSLGVESHLELMTRYLLLCDSYGLVFCGAPSLTRGRVCLLYTLLVLASAVFLGSESLGTRDRILLSQIWDLLLLSSFQYENSTLRKPRQ
jgi:hypothetical protein